MLKTLTSLRTSRQGAAISGVVELALAYVCGSIALGSGAVWWYALTIFLTVTALGSFVTAVKSHDHK